MDDAHYTLPEGSVGASFTKEEKDRMDRKAQEISDRLAKTCKHLVVGEGGPRKRKIDWDKIREERERLEQKERDALREADGFEE